jgi:Tfp pilus assembly protein PilF
MAPSKEELYKEFLKGNPEDPMVHFSLALLYLDENRLEAAIEALETTIKLQPDYMAAIWKLANAYEGMQEIEKAVQAYEQTLQLAQQNGDSNMIEDVQERLGFLK